METTPTPELTPFDALGLLMVYRGFGMSEAMRADCEALVATDARVQEVWDLYRGLERPTQR